MIPIISIPGVDGVRHTGVNTVIIRENTEGEYSGIEHEVYPGVIESIKVTTKAASLKVIYLYLYLLYNIYIYDIYNIYIIDC